MAQASPPNQLRRVSGSSHERFKIMGSLARDIHPALHSHRFMVGRDAAGRWLVSDEKAMVGGIFADRELAVRFALAESDHIPGAVFCAPAEIILSLDRLSLPLDSNTDTVGTVAKVRTARHA